MKVVLAIGGFDPSSGAGVTADARTIERAAAWPLTVATTLTVQSPARVHASHPVDAAILARRTPTSA